MDDEGPISLKQALRSFYPPGASLATIHRHVTRGVRTRVGVVKLEAVRLGGRWTTTAQAIRRFQDRCTAEAGGTPPPGPDVAASRARARAYLDAIGVK